MKDSPNHSKYSYQNAPFLWHVGFALACLIGGTVSTLVVLGKLKTLHSGQGVITLSSSDLSGPIFFLVALIPIVLEFIRRRSGWMVSTRKQFLTLIIPLFILLGVEHDIIDRQYPKYFVEKGWEFCGSQSYNSRNSSRRYDTWMPVGQCPQKYTQP